MQGKSQPVVISLTRFCWSDAGVQSFGVGHAVNGDDPGGRGHCQETQSGQEWSLQGEGLTTR